MANPLIPNLKQTTPVEVDTMDSVYIKEQAISLSPIGDIGVDRQDVTYEKSQATPLKQFNTADLDKQELTYISNQSTTNTISIPSGLDAQISTYQLQQKSRAEFSPRVFLLERRLNKVRTPAHLLPE